MDKSQRYWTLNVFLIFFINTLHHSVCEICTKEICEYDFVVRWTQSMTYLHKNGWRYDVKEDGDKLKIEGNHYTMQMPKPIGMEVKKDKVITLDGVKRLVITVNEQFPGPPIEVMEGATILVRVRNELIVDSLTVHWHGIHQKGTPWMDGPAYVTQDPVLPGQSFEYKFVANPPGTHWYHSHVGHQRIDGLYGMLIIHESKPKLPSYHMLLTDWWHQQGGIFAAQIPVRMAPVGSGYLWASHHNSPVGPDNNPTSHLPFVSALINGRGQYGNSTVPLESFVVEPDTKYRFRIVNSGADFIFDISIDGHNFEVVNSDSHEMKPVKVEYLTIDPGESYDIILTTLSSGGTAHWIRVRTQTEKMGTKPLTEKEEVKAKLLYKGHENMTPMSKDHECTKGHIDCRVLNCPYKDYGKEHGKTCLHIHDAVAANTNSNKGTLYGLDTPESEVEDFFFNTANQKGPGINGLRYKSTDGHYFTDHRKIKRTPCDTVIRKHSSKYGLEELFCTHVVEIPRDKTVQLVFTNYQGTVKGGGGSDAAGGGGGGHGGHGGRRKRDESMMGGEHGMHMEDHSNMDHEMPMGGHSDMDHEMPMGEESHMDHNMTHAMPGHMGDDTMAMGNGSHHGAMVHSMHHSMHLHGYSFAVLYIGYPPIDPVTGHTDGHNTDIKCNNFLCTKPKWAKKDTSKWNFKSPPIKNTLSVPASGYAVVRLKTDNVGYWFLHCHMMTHLYGGMGAILDIAGDEAPSIPKEIDPCYDFRKTDTTTEKTYALTIGSLSGIAVGCFMLGAILVVCLGYTVSKYRLYSSQQKTDEKRPKSTSKVVIDEKKGSKKQQLYKANTSNSNNLAEDRDVAPFVTKVSVID